MKKSIKKFLVLCVSICFMLGLTTPSLAQIYLTYDSNYPYMIKHNQDGSVDYVRYKRKTCNPTNEPLWDYSWNEFKNNGIGYTFIPIYALTGVYIYAYYSNYEASPPQATYKIQSALGGHAGTYYLIFDAPSYDTNNIKEIYEHIQNYSLTKNDTRFPTAAELETLWDNNCQDIESTREEKEISQTLSDIFSDPGNVGFKKIDVGRSYILALRNDGIFKIRSSLYSESNAVMEVSACLDDEYLTTTLESITEPIKDLMFPIQHMSCPKFMMLITEDGKQIPINLSNQFGHNEAYNKEEIDAITTHGKPVMLPSQSNVPPQADVFGAEFDTTYPDGIGIKVKKNGNLIGNFKAFKNEQGVKYNPERVYIEGDSIVASVIVRNGRYQGLKICGEWNKLAPFDEINEPKKCY